MYKILTVLLFGFLSLVHANELIEGSGKTIVKKEYFGNASKFNITVSVDTVISKSKLNFYELTADDNIINFINISSNNNELTISTDKSFKTNSKFTLHIHTNKITNLRVDGSMDVELNNLDENSLYIRADGVIDISSKVSSSISKLSISTDGAVDINFKNLKSEYTVLNLSGIGDIVLNSGNKPEIIGDGIHDVVNVYKPLKGHKKNTTTKVTKSKSTEAPSRVYTNAIPSATKEPMYDILLDLINEDNLNEFKHQLDRYNVNILNKINPTLLYVSSTKDRKAFVETLVHHGVSVDHKTSKHHETALQGAIRNNKSNNAFYLIHNSKNLNIKNSQGQTALHMATTKAMNSMIRLLLDKGANKRLTNSQGQTPYDIAKDMIAIEKEVLKLLYVKSISDIKERKYYNSNRGPKSKIEKSNLNVYIGK